jgi:predicted metal-dependent HD superfamily phosphohydrolase
LKGKKLRPVKVKGKLRPIEIRSILYHRPDFHYEQAFVKIEAFLVAHLPKNYTYHTIWHIRDVVEQAEKIAKREKMSVAEMEDIKLAAWLHDVGYIWEPMRHEARGAEYAATILTALNFPKAKINTIKGMIMATKIPQSPKNIYEQIICDADLDYLGRTDYIENSNCLLQEIELNKKITHLEWLTIQDKFLKSHQFFTKGSQKSRNSKKQVRVQQIQEQIKAEKYGTSGT